MTNTTRQGLERWHALFTTDPTPEAIASVLHQNAVFHSPVVHTPQSGRDLVVAYLTAAGKILGNDSFEYVDKIVDDHRAVLEFTTEVDGIKVNGVDMITFDEEGLITDFKVLVRPLKAINKVWEMMGAQLAKS